MDPAPRSERLARAGRWLAFGGFAVLVVTVGLGVVGAVLGPVLPAPTVAARTVGPASILPTRPAQRVNVDPFSQRLTVEPWLSGQLPGEPFAYEAPTSTKGLFTEATIGGVTTDPAWIRDENLPVAVIAADMELRAVVEGDLAVTGRGVVAELSRRLYQDLSGLQVTDVRSDAPTTIGPHPAQWAHANVTGGLSDGRTERAALSLLLVALPNGRCFAFVEVRPDHPSAQAHFAALDAAAASIVSVG